MSYTNRMHKSIDIQALLYKKGFDVIDCSGYKLNNIMIEFLKEYKLPYKKWIYRYKGLNTADLINAVTIKDNWEEFNEWIENKVI